MKFENCVECQVKLLHENICPGCGASHCDDCMDGVLCHSCRSGKYRGYVDVPMPAYSLNIKMKGKSWKKKS